MAARDRTRKVGTCILPKRVRSLAEYRGAQNTAWCLHSLLLLKSWPSPRMSAFDASQKLAVPPLRVIPLQRRQITSTRTVHCDVTIMKIGAISLFQTIMLAATVAISKEILSVCLHNRATSHSKEYVNLSSTPSIRYRSHTKLPTTTL